MQFHYLSIVGDESAPKACKLQHVCVIRGQHEARHSLKKRVCVKEEGKEAQPPLSLHSYLYQCCASLR